MLSSDQIRVRRSCSTWVPRFGSLPIRQVADRDFLSVFRMENVFHAIGDCKSSGIGSSIFHSVDDGSGSCSRRHEGDDFVCSVRFLVYAALYASLENGRNAISGSKMYMLWFVHDSAS